MTNYICHTTRLDRLSFSIAQGPGPKACKAMQAQDDNSTFGSIINVQNDVFFNTQHNTKLFCALP
ncbi:hypothetical protein [Candidatus Megaera venefica]|uniref:hypothetical protein n=1 Tax=Candidatus Megaera venefica TaxID=2055910 RepID=UPI002AD4635D|nr:hypothetical protein [Candidatus Megaera venefica]